MRHVALTVFAVVFAAACTAQLAAALPPVEDVLSLAEAHRHRADSAVVLEEDFQFRQYRAWGVAHIETIHRLLVLILSTEGFRYARLRIHHGERNDLRAFEARVIHPDGRVERVGPEHVHLDHVRRSSHLGKPDLEVTTLQLPGVRVGSLVEVRVVLEVVSPHFCISRQFIGRDAPVLRYRAEVVVPAQRGVAMAVHNMLGTKTPLDDSDVAGYRLDVRDIAPVEEDGALPRRDRRPWWEVRLWDPDDEDHPCGDGHHWRGLFRALARSLSDLEGSRYQGIDIENPILEGADLFESVNGILTSARRRLVVTGAGDPHDGAGLGEVLANGRGTRFDRAALVYALLRRAGVEVYFAATAVESSDVFDFRFPSPWGLDRYILTIPGGARGGGDLWIDPSCDACDAGVLPDEFIGGPAIVFGVAETGEEQGEVFAKMSTVRGTALPRWPESLSHRIEVAANGDATIIRTEVAANENAQRITADISQRTLAERNAEARRIEASYGESARLIDQESWRCSRIPAQCVRVLRLEATGLAEPTPIGLVLPLSVAEERYDDRFSEEESLDDAVLLLDEDFEERVTLVPPVGHKVAEAPMGQTTVDGPVHVAIHAELGEDVSFIRAVKWTAGRRSAADYPKMKAAIDAFRAWRFHDVLLVPTSDEGLAASP